MRRLDQPHRAAVGGTAGRAATTAHRSFCGRRAQEHEAAGGESHVLLGFLWTAPRPPPHRPQSHRPPPRSPSCPSPRARPTTRRLSFAPPATRHRHCAAPSAARRATAFRRPRPPRAPPRATGRRGPQAADASGGRSQTPMLAARRPRAARSFRRRPPRWCVETPPRRHVAPLPRRSQRAAGRHRGGRARFCTDCTARRRR